MYFVCFIEDEQGPKQVGGGSGSLVGHIEMMGQHESDPTAQKVTGKCFLSYVITILSYKIRTAYSKIEMHGVADPTAEDGSESRAEPICTDSGRLLKTNCCKNINLNSICLSTKAGPSAKKKSAEAVEQTETQMKEQHENVSARQQVTGNGF